MGAAILDYQQHGKASRLHVLSSMFDEDEMPVAHLFRTERDMPPLERKALSLCRGNILDVGAGAGCHVLALQQKGQQVMAIDISPLSCEAMLQRGIQNVQCINLFNPLLKATFDTILLLMNGTGIAGKVANLPTLLNRLKELLATDGQVLIDSSDLKYLFEDEDGTYNMDPDDPYYGEVDYQMVYGKVKGEPFDWLYADFPLLQTVAATCGLKAELIAEGEHYDYLARITRQ